MNTRSDSLQRFLFEHAPVRGEIVQLEHTWLSVLQRHEYPTILRNIMGELCAAAVLLAATLKLQGSLILQIHGKGAIKLLVVECTGNLELRATAKWDGELVHDTLPELVGEGRFVITLDPKDGNQAYQGIVALEGNSVAEMLQNYMERSEQLETRLWLAADGGRAAGMLLQKLPAQHHQDEETWSRLNHLAATVTAQELLSLPAPEVLRRLFHEEDVRVFEPQEVEFNCTCSRANVARMLKLLGQEEVDSVLAEQGEIEVFCEFCNERYIFDAIDARAIFIDALLGDGQGTRH